MSEQRVRLNPRGPEPAARPSRGAGLTLWCIAAAGLLLSGFPVMWLLAGRAEMDAQLRLLIANLLYYLPFVALPLLLYVRRRPGVAAALRPNPISLFSTISIVAMALLGVLLANDLTVLWAIPLQELGLDVSGTGLPIPGDSRGLTLCVLTVAVLPGVCEEFLFRGAVLASMEDRLEGFVFALAFGVLCDLALTAPLPCLYTIAFPLTALLAALIARSVLQPGILCSLAVSTAAFVLVDLITAVTLLAGGRSELSAIALRAVQELALSLPLLIVCHPVLAFLHRKFTL